MMEVPVSRVGQYPYAEHHTVLNLLLDLTPLDPLEWHAVVIYHREVTRGVFRYGTPYPDNYDLTFEDSQPPTMKYIYPILGPEFEKHYIRWP